MGGSQIAHSLNRGWDIFLSRKGTPWKVVRTGGAGSEQCRHMMDLLSKLPSGVQEEMNQKEQQEVKRPLVGFFPLQSRGWSQNLRK